MAEISLLQQKKHYFSHHMRKNHYTEKTDIRSPSGFWGSFYIAVPVLPEDVKGRGKEIKKTKDV